MKNIQCSGLCNKCNIHVVKHSLGRADVTLRHAKGKNRRKYSVRMCITKRTHRYARHEGEKWDDFPDVRPSECITLKHNLRIDWKFESKFILSISSEQCHKNAI